MIIAFTIIFGIFAVTEVSATAPIITHYFEPVDGEVITISVDVMQTGEGIYGIEFSSPKNINTPYDTANMASYGMVRIYNGQLLFRANGGWIAPNQVTQSGINTVKFTENEWHNIKLRVTRDEKLAELYLDEVYAGTMNLLNELPNPAHIIRVFSQGKKNFEMNFVSVSASDKGEVSAVVDTVDEKNKQITVTFSENVGISGAELKAINCVEGEHTVSLSVAESQGSIVTFGFDEDLRPSTEYAIVFPEGMIGSNSGILKNRYAYFTTDGATNSIIEDECDYEDGEAKFWVEQPNNVNPIVDTESDYGKVFFVRARKNADDSLLLNGFTPPTEDVSSISFDIQPRRANVKSAIEIWSSATSTPPISIVLGSTGYILCKRDDVSNSDWFTQTNDEENIYIDDVIGTYANKEWLNFKVTYNKVDKIATIYLNGQAVKTFGESEMSGYTQFDNVKFFFPAQGNVRTNLLYMDNIKGEVEALVPFVSETRFYDALGNTYGGAETIGRLVKSIDVKFSSAIEEDTLDGAVTLLYDGEEIGFAGEYDEGKKIYRIFPETLPQANAEISLEINGATDSDGAEMSPFVLSAVTDDTADGLQVFKMNFANSDGEPLSELTNGDLYVQTVVANLTDEDRNVMVSAMGMQENALKKFGYMLETLEANSILVVNETENAISFSSNVIDEAIITVQDADTGIPLAGANEIARAEAILVDGNVEVSGETYGETIVEVFAPDKTFADIESASDFRDVLLYKNQIFAEGNFKLDFNIAYNGAESGMYTVKVTNEENAKSYEILYVNGENAKVVFETIFKPAVDGGNAEEIGTVLLENKFDLYVDDRYIDEEVAKRAAELITKEGVTLETAETVINKAVAISALEKGKITTVLGESEIFDIENSEIAELYNASYVRQSTIDEIMSRMSGKTFADFEDFGKKLNDAFALSVVKNPTEPSCVKTVLEALGITAKNDNCYSAVSGKNYDTVDALKTALSKAAENGGSSGGGGGGSSSGGGASIISNKAIVDEIAVEVDTKSSEIAEKKFFSDIESVDWAKEAINGLAERGVINGKFEGHFCPYDTITREEFTKILVAAFDIKGDADIKFADAVNGAWYYDFIRRATGAGIVTGYSDGTFGIGQNITRADMAVMIYRAAQHSGKVLSGADGARFTDDYAIMDYAKTAVYTLKNSNIINGREQGKFEPQAFATRAEAAKMIYNILNK